MTEAEIPGAAAAQRPPVRTWAVAAATFLAAVVLLGLRAAPGVTFEDAGELAAAASVWGVPHPPGYPLWMLLAAPVASLAEALGVDPAAALVWLSVVAASATAAMLAAVASGLGATLPVAVAGALVVLAAPNFTSQALIVEVYGVAAAVQAGLIAVALGRRPRPFATGLLAGLGLAAHVSTIFLAPVVAYGVLRTRSGLRGPLRAALGSTAGLAVFAWVPIAALRDPAVNWGAPSTLPRLVDHLTRRQYAGAGGDLGQRLEFVLQQLFGQWPLVAAVAVALAFVPLAGRPGAAERLRLPLLLTLAWTVVVGIAALPYDVSPLALRARVGPMFVPGILVLVALFGVGVARLQRALLDRSLGSSAVSTVLVAAVAAVAVTSMVAWPSRIHTTDMRGADGAETYLRETLAACPPDAIVVCSRLGYTDVLSFPLMYGQVSLGLRPDVTVIDRGLLPADWYREQLAARAPDLAPGLEALGNTYAADPERFADPRLARLASAEFLQVVFDGDRPVVMVERPGPNLLRGRPAAPDADLWHIGVEPRADEGPVELSWPWLEDQPPSPWTDELSAIARERDGQRAELLRAAGRAAQAAALETGRP